MNRANLLGFKSIKDAFDPFGENLIISYYSMSEQEPEGGCPISKDEPKKSTYDKEKYQANKEKILAYRKERYKQLHAYKYDIKILSGEFIISFD